MTDGLSDQLITSIDRERLKDILCREAKVEKVGGIAMLYYDTLSKINIYKYAGNSVWFDGRSYILVDKDDLESAIFTSMRYLQVSDGILNKEFQSMCKTIWRNLSRRNFEVSRRKLCFINCVLDTNTMLTSDFSPEHFVISRINYEYNPEATCPKWMKFLGEVLPDPAIVAAMQEYYGLMFVDRSIYKIEKMMVQLGTGRNGKSVVYEVITSVVGEDNVSTFEINDLVSGGDMKKNIADVNGKTINYCSELSKKELAGSTFKKLISGEAMQARQIYREPFVAKAIPLMISNSNELPATSDYTKGYFARYLIIPFNVTISDEKQNRHLHTELKQELPGILNWVLEGHKRVAANGYMVSEPNEVKDRVLEYEINSNSILKFIEDQEYYNIPVYKTHAPMQITAKDLYKQYVEYCRSSGYNAFSNVKFAEKLKEKNFAKDRKSDGMTYTYYLMPMIGEWDRLASQGLLTMSKEEFSRVVAYKCMGRTLVKPSVPKQRELEYDLPPI